MKLSLSKKIIIYFEIISLLVIVLITAISYFYSARIIKNEVNIRLSNTAHYRENYIKQYLYSNISDIEIAVKNNHINSVLVGLLEEKSNLDNLKPVDLIMDGMISTSDLIDISILNNEGIILDSNNKQEVGKIKSNELYFINAKENYVIESFVYDTTFKKNIIIISIPIKNNNGASIGVLTEKIDINSINILMKDRLGLGATGETYLVNSVNFVMTDLLKEKNASLKKTLYLPYINLCLKNNSNYYSDIDYNGNKVFGFAYWFPLIQSCVVSEIDQSEVMQPITELLPQFFSLIILILIFILILGFSLGESIASPINVLRNQALRVKEGDLDVVIESTSKDEIGEMAIVFKEMLIKLKELYSNLESKVKERTEKLEDSEKKLEKNLQLSEMNNKIMMGREIEMIKLKERIKELEENL